MDLHFFLHFIELQTLNQCFPFWFSLATRALCSGDPRAVEGQGANGAFLGKKIPLLFYKSFRGLVHTVVLTLPCVCTALRSELSDYWGIATETVQSGICCCYLYSWSSYKLRGYGALTGSHSYFFSSEKPGKRRGEKRAIINLMPN